MLILKIKEHFNYVSPIFTQKMGKKRALNKGTFWLKKSVFIQIFSEKWPYSLGFLEKLRNISKNDYKNLKI